MSETIDNRTSHHKWEQGIINMLNLDGWDLTWTGENFEHFDAMGKTPKGMDCIIEFKLRHKYYNTKILEKYKYEKLMAYPDCLKFYFVADQNGWYMYWLDKLEIPEQPTYINCKSTEKYDNRELVNKDVYFLSESQAIIINKY